MNKIENSTGLFKNQIVFISSRSGYFVGNLEGKTKSKVRIRNCCKLDKKRGRPANPEGSFNAGHWQFGPRHSKKDIGGKVEIKTVPLNQIDATLEQLWLRKQSV